MGDGCPRYDPDAKFSRIWGFVTTSSALGLLTARVTVGGRGLATVTTALVSTPPCLRDSSRVTGPYEAVAGTAISRLKAPRGLRVTVRDCR